MKETSQKKTDALLEIAKTIPDRFIGWLFVTVLIHFTKSVP